MVYPCISWRCHVHHCNINSVCLFIWVSSRSNVAVVFAPCRQKTGSLPLPLIGSIWIYEVIVLSRPSFCEDDALFMMTAELFRREQVCANGAKRLHDLRGSVTRWVVWDGLTCRFLRLIFGVTAGECRWSWGCLMGRWMVWLVANSCVWCLWHEPSLLGLAWLDLTWFG